MNVPPSRPASDPLAIYHEAHVRRRMREFLGDDGTGRATAVFLRRCDCEGFAQSRVTKPEELGRFLDAGVEVGRSLWDRQSLVAHLDVEYVNADYPGEAIWHPQRAFALQWPLVESIEEILAEAGIDALHLLTGRGHHFVWRVPLASSAAAGLVGIGRLPRHMAEKSVRVRGPGGEVAGLDTVRGHAGLALLMEFLAHRVVERAAPRCAIPVELTDVRVGRGERGRESLVVDVSEYGDPVYTRTIRVPYSTYLKPWLKPGLFDDEHKDRLPPLYAIPQHEMDVDEGLEIMRDPARVVELARRAPTRIPESAAGTRHLLEDYRGGALARFHDEYFRVDHEPTERWARTYDQVDLAALPVCVAESLRHPNDVLLQPAGIRRLAAVLWAEGWHPRHCAGLLRSKYERDHGWGRRWFDYDAATRADFYTRLFTGAIAVGLDELVDMNCLSEKEKGMCVRPHEECGLSAWRQRALERSERRRT